MLYNRNYGKLVGQSLQYAPKNIEIDGTWYIPASGERLISQGYYFIVDTPYPTDGKSYAMSWIQEEDRIVKVWTEIPTPPQPEPEPDPIVDLQEASVDHEYRITLLELGVE